MRKTNAVLPPLTPAEEQKSYAKYYYRELPQPRQEILESLNPAKQLLPEHAILAHNINDMLKPGYLDGENGFCLLPGGGAYVAVNTRMPDVTFEKFRWFCVWRMTDDQDLRYKIWCPGSHFKSKNDMRGNYEWMLEDIGWGTEEIYGRPISLDKLGLDMGLLKASDSLTMGAVCTLALPFGGPLEERAPLPMTICHFIRPYEGGIELRSRFWMGFMCDDEKGGLYLAIGPDMEIDKEKPYKLALHCCQEFENMRQILPQLYSEEA